MNNKEKIREIINSVMQIYMPSGYNVMASYFDLENIAMQTSQWKDEQVKQLLIEKTKFLSPSAAQVSIRRCTIEEIYEELFNERMPNSNPYIK